jgi:protoheme IX farnesyltransferase
MESTSDVMDLPESLPVAPVDTRPHTRLVDFYELTKPRLNFLVLTTTVVGFYMAATPGMNWLPILHLILGTAMTAAASAVLNQCFEREYDALMPRTRNRPLPAGRLSLSEGVAFGVLLGAGGIAYLALMVNHLTALVGAMTLFSYLFIYTPMKRRSSLNTIIGAIPGALPPVMGFTAATNTITPEALALFGILFFWQMPHFLAIAILYRNDYALGGYKMLPVIDPELHLTGKQIVIYGMALVPVSLLPGVLGLCGAVYVAAALLLGLGFLSYGVSCATSRSRLDARKLFFASIIYLPLLLAFMMIDKM